MSLALQPSTTYYYRFPRSQAQSPIGRTRTLPVAPATHLRMAVVSCSSLAHGYFNAYRRIAERADLDLVVHLGDYIYEYGSGEFGNLRAYEPAAESCRSPTTGRATPSTSAMPTCRSCTDSIR